MKVAVFNAKQYDKDFFTEANKYTKHNLVFLEVRLNHQTVKLAEGFEAVCVFTNDILDKQVIEDLHNYNIRLVALRCAGYNNIDLETCEISGITVVRVPAYSPYSVAEHTLALVMALNRNIHRAYNRVREGNFSLNGLMGYDLNNRTVGIVGTGKIGTCVAQIFKGIGCKLLAYDPHPDIEGNTLGIDYVDFKTLLRKSDIITLHCPLNDQNRHLINKSAFLEMKDGVMVINTGRGGLLDTRAAIDALKSGKIGALGLDVYEEEMDLFFQDHSGTIIQDDVFSRLLTFHNVLITGHQAFFTKEAMNNIAKITLENIQDFEKNLKCANEVKIPK